MSVELEMRFALGRRVASLFWIERELAGDAFAFSVEGRRVTLALPSFAGRQGAPFLGYGGEDPDDPHSLAPAYLTATVELANRDETAEGMAAAQLAFGRLMAWARIKQPWVGHPDVPVEPIDREGILRDGSGGASLVQLRPNRPSVSIAGALPFSRDELAHAASDESPAVADDLLAEARLLAHWAIPRDPYKAVLIAAMACELKAKDILSEAAPSPLLDWMLGNSRAFPRAALELFTGIPKVLLGRSLRDDDRALMNEVKELFEMRNRVVHRGERPSENDAADMVRSAIGAFAWLGTLG